MTDLDISLVYMTYRPGGFDLLVDGLKRQIYENWELIVVDDLAGRNMSKLLHDNDLPLTHYSPGKKKCYDDTPFGQVNAMNTGMLHATGDLVVFMHDYQWVPPTGLKRWNDFYNEHGHDKVLTSGVGLEVSYAGDFTLGDDTIFAPPFNGWQPLFEPNVGRFYRTADTTPGGCWHPGVSNPADPPFENFYSGFPIEYLDAINGFDERCDYNHQFPLYATVRQSELNGYKVMVDQHNQIYYINHRGWSIGDPSYWHVVRVAQNLKYHGGVDWVKTSPNPFDLKSQRPKQKFPRHGKIDCQRDIVVNHGWGDLIFSHDTVFNDEDYEGEIIELFGSIKSTDNVIDVGAHQGFYTTYFATHTNRVHAFEPNPTNYKYLTGNVAKFPNVVAVNSAVGNTDGVATMNMWNDDNPDKYSGRHSFMIELGGTIPLEVKETKLDTYVSENNLTIDFLKIDVEGWEWEVIKGGDAFIRSQKPKMIIEIHTAQCQKNLSEYFNLYKIPYRIIKSGIPTIGHLANYMVVGL